MRASSPFLDVARELSLVAGRRLMDLRGSPLVRERKPDHSLVTNADHEADQILRQGLHKAFPDHSILTEESGLEGAASAEYVWVVDPLDGTKAYANAVTGYSVMVGLLKEGKPYAGVVFDPLEGHLYEAMRGGGTSYSALSPALPREGGGGYCRVPSPFSGEGVRERVHVSSRSDLSQMPVITSTGFPNVVEKALMPLLPGPWIPAVNSVGIKVGYLVRQIVDIYINHHRVHYWDTCAPQIILEEAGGTITFLDGSPLPYAIEGNDYRHKGATLATNQIRHQEVLGLLRTVKPPLA